MIKELEKYKETINGILKIANNVFSELGPGFDETDYQTALQIEFSKSKDFESLRETVVELFYKDQYLKFGELDFLITPKPESKGYPFPFFIETKVINDEVPKAAPLDQIRRYLMSLPKNNSSLVNNIEVAALLVFIKDSKIIGGEPIEKDGNTILKRKPAYPGMPETKVYIKSYYYDSSDKTIKLIDD